MQKRPCNPNKVRRSRFSENKREQPKAHIEGDKSFNESKQIMNIIEFTEGKDRASTVWISASVYPKAKEPNQQRHAEKPNEIKSAAAKFTNSHEVKGSKKSGSTAVK